MLKKLKNADKCTAILTALAAVDFIYIFFVYHLTFVEKSTLPNACTEELVTSVICFILLVCADILRIRYIKGKDKRNGK